MNPPGNVLRNAVIRRPDASRPQRRSPGEHRRQTRQALQISDEDDRRRHERTAKLRQRLRGHLVPWKSPVHGERSVTAGLEVSTSHSADT